MRPGRLAFLVAGFMGLCVAQAASAADITFSQSDWPGGAVTISTFGFLSTGGGITNQASGGNPGSYVTVNVDHGLVGPSVHYFIWTGVQVNAWVYVPSVSGAISSFDFSADVLIGNTNPPSFIAFVAQGGNYYFGEGVEESVSGWTNSARTGATQLNFGLLNTATGFWNFSLHPDFSASGAPITFGYALGTNNIGGPIPAGSDTISYDNITYTIHNNAPAIPEPTSMLLVGIGLVAAAVRRRQQRRA